jgi:hypothetical protein
LGRGVVAGVTTALPIFVSLARVRAYPAPPYQPDALECAILLLLLVQPKERTRIRLAEITLKRLWKRRRLEVQWLFRAGSALFYAGTTFGLIKVRSVEGWPRVTSKRLEAELEKVARGRFDFTRYYHCCSTARPRSKGPQFPGPNHAATALRPGERGRARRCQGHGAIEPRKGIVCSSCPRL